jgi:hypothetical protein
MECVDVVVTSNDGKSLQQQTQWEISVLIEISDDRDGIDETIVGVLCFFNVRITLMDNIKTQSLYVSPDSSQSLRNQTISPEKNMNVKNQPSKFVFFKSIHSRNSFAQSLPSSNHFIIEQFRSRSLHSFESIEITISINQASEQASNQSGNQVTKSINQ